MGEAPCSHPGTGEGLGMLDNCHNGNLHYGSSWWSTTSPKNDGANRIYEPYYTQPVTDMKICMNGRCHQFSMKHGKTLREMITTTPLATRRPSSTAKRVR